MFAVIYTFIVKKGRDTDFIYSWEGLTRLIYQYENSFGSKLHRASDGKYIAYALWPDKETWENAGQNLPDEASEFRVLMKESCSEITTDHEMDTISDLTRDKQYG